MSDRWFGSWALLKEDRNEWHPLMTCSFAALCGLRVRAWAIRRGLIKGELVP